MRSDVTVRSRSTEPLLFFLCFCSLSWVSPSPAQDLTLQFDQLTYVTSPGSPLSVGIRMDQAPTDGLFSYGVKLLFDPASSPVSGVGAISPAAALDFNGPLGAGAFKAVGSGFAGAKGTVDIFANPVTYYSGVLLTTFNLEYQTPGDYTLDLGLFNTLGPTERIFVSGSGASLDNNIQLRTATVHVVPEPSITALVLVGSLGMLLALRWRRGANETSADA